MVPNRKLGLAPLPLSLIDKALRGSIEWVVPLHANVGILDCWRVYQSAPTNTSVTLLVKTPAETEWTAATTESVQARLNAGVLRVRVELTRQSLDDPKPYLRAIRLRYQQLAGDIHVRVNAPLGDAALSMHEFGIVETFTALSFIFDDTLPLISPLDWIYDERTGNKWIIQSVQRHDPYGHLIYSHTQTRLLQNFDCQWEYPV